MTETSSPTAVAPTQRLTITRLGHEGDGLATTRDGGTVFVPYTAPGDIVDAEMTGDRGRIVEILTPGPGRAYPECQHFGVCGGCKLQHITVADYIAWKTGILIGALAAHGLNPPVEPMVLAPPGSRRRAILAATRTGAGVILGFHEPRGHRIFELKSCPVLVPDIVERLPALREIADALLPRFPGRGENKGSLRLVATLADNGIDLVVEGAGTSPPPDARTRVADAARHGRILRVSLDRDPIYATADPFIRFGTVDVVPPPAVFLQAVPEIERAMAVRIVEAVAGKRHKVKRVADLYCGAGTFTFPLAAKASVLAVDSDKRALAALVQAFRRAQGIQPVTTLARDLFRDPMAARELAGIDCVVFDPPRAGAAAQAERIAASTVATVIAVSCAPGTLARDLATLVAGGYEIESITPYDQFLSTPHLETVAVLRRRQLGPAQ